MLVEKVHPLVLFSCHHLKSCTHGQEEPDIFGVGDSPAVRLCLQGRLELLLPTPRTPSSSGPWFQPPTGRPVQSHQVAIKASSKQVVHPNKVPVWNSMRRGEGVGQ